MLEEAEEEEVRLGKEVEELVKVERVLTRSGCCWKASWKKTRT